MSENISFGKTIKKKSRKRITTADIVIIALSAAIIAVCAWISIPTAVPFTLQTFAVFTVAGIFGARRGTLSALVYILLGAVGAPVFARFTGGIGTLLGSTGGYTVGFIFIALIVGFAAEKFNRRPIPMIMSMLLGLLVCYVFGTTWFMALYTRDTGVVGLGTVMGWCVVPFIIPDCVKIACAAAIVSRVGKRINF